MLWNFENFEILSKDRSFQNSYSNVHGSRRFVSPGCLSDGRLNRFVRLADVLQLGGGSRCLHWLGSGRGLVDALKYNEIALIVETPSTDNSAKLVPIRADPGGAGRQR